MEKVIHSLTVPVPRPRLLRVAAYARVSSGKDAMLHSLSRQISYYSQMIQKHPGWTYAGCYADADHVDQPNVHVPQGPTQAVMRMRTTPAPGVSGRSFSGCWRTAGPERSTGS